jgi:hypothetical protein
MEYVDMASPLPRRAVLSAPLAALAGNLASTSSSDARTVDSKLKDVVSVKDFGAIGDGVTDDTTATQLAINYCVSFGYDKPKALYFPAGRYLLTANNVLGQWNSIDTSAYRGVFGLRLFGDSGRASVLVLQNSGPTDRYFWDNYSGSGTAAANNSLLFPTFERIGFAGLTSGGGKVHGFRAYGTPNGYPSQGMTFDQCYFSNMGDVLQLSGPNVASAVNADSNNFLGCFCLDCDRLIYSDNSQAFVHNVIATNVEFYKIAAFEFVAGGSLEVVGGSYISTPSAISYLLKISPPTGIGNYTSFKFIGVRTEMRNTNAKLLRLSGTDNDAVVSFDTCCFQWRDGGGIADALLLDAQSKFRLSFYECVFSGGDGVTWNNNGVANYWITSGPKPVATFANCSGVTRANITWQSNTLGFTRIVGDGSGVNFEGGAFGLFVGNDTTNPTITTKVAIGYGSYWPNSDGNTLTCTVPIGSTIKAIYVKKGAHGRSSATYQLQVTDGAGTPISVPSHALGSNVSTVGPRESEHVITIDRLLKCAADPTSATVVVRTSAGNAGDATVQNLGSDATNDLFLVEYF